MKAVTLLCSFFLSMLTACGPAPQTEIIETEHRLVQTKAVQSGPAVDLIEVSGVASFRDEARLSFKVGGLIENITVREGEFIKKGQRLAWLNKQEVSAAVSQASAEFEKAQRDLTRGRMLHEQEVISKVQLNNLITNAQSARAQLSQAQFASKTAEIHAQDTAVVLKRLAQVGEVVSPGQTVLLLGNKGGGLIMKAGLTDKQAVHVQIGNKTELTFDALPELKWSGRVIEMSQAADPATGTFGVIVAINQSEHNGVKLLAGMQGRVRIEPTNFSETRSYVPIESVVEGHNKSAWIYILQTDNTVKRQPVQIAFIANDQLALTTPLAAGTLVVSTGAAYLQDGETVEIQGAFE